MPLDLGIAGRRVLVTAASQGIGFACARSFLEAGGRVVVNSSNPGRLHAAVERLRGLGEVHEVVADLSRGDELDRLVAEARTALGGVDTLVYVTGSPAPGTVLEKSYDEWESAARLLTVGPAYLARRVAEAMLAGGRPGRMVFLASFAIREPSVNLALSNVCRIAVAGLVRSLARELGPKGIRVNGLLPGYIATDRLSEVFADQARRRGSSVEAVRAEVEREIPLGRIAEPEELARAAVFLASDLAAYVTGALLPVDGGLLRSVG